MKAKINLDLAREAVISLVPDHGCLSIGDIEKIVCKYYKVDRSMLRSKSRKKIHTFPRNVYIYLCRQNTDSTLEEIGRSIDRNHSTVLYSAEMIAQKIRSDSRVKKEIDYLDLRLKDVMN
jgi:chromosomal replication initiator protein